MARPSPHLRQYDPSAQALARDRRARAVALRKAGATYDRIARELGYHDASGARKAVLAAFREALDDADVAELRALEADRLDRLQLAVWATALAGDRDAIELVLKISARRSRLLGLDAPVRREVDLAVLKSYHVTNDPALL